MRLHLFEWEDQAWFPASLRAAITSYLAATYGITPIPKLWAERLSTLLATDRLNEIVDLGSGSGGPLPLVVNELETQGFKLRVILTDLYPNKALYPNSTANTPFEYWPEPVDAASVPASLRGIRTMFASFHHFRPQLAHQILRDAFTERVPICIFEGTSRTLPSIAATVLIPLLVLLLTPKVRPFSWVQIVFTYLLPILPFLIFWDGLISQIRTYSIRELEELTRNLQSPEYSWEAGLMQVPRIPVGFPYLIGRPARYLTITVL
jgi:hypothetical protein